MLRRSLLIFLLIEFLDELVFGSQGAAWPLIRDDLALNYAQIGLLLSVPALISNVIEPALGILADVWRRQALILGGGILFVLSLALTAGSFSFGVLLLAFVLFYPASGAFVSLSQAALMDMQPDRQEQNMARWTLAGSLGVVLGPLALGAAVGLGLGWRGLYAGLALLAAAALALAWRRRGQGVHAVVAPAGSFGESLRAAGSALRRGEVRRWLALLQFSDLMLDVLFGYLALYFVDVAGATPQQAGVAVAVWSGVGLLGDFLLIPLLERWPGLRYLRLSAALMLALYPAFLLIPDWWGKLAAVGLLGLLNSGWYAILKAQLYGSLPGRSGVVLAVDSLAGWPGSLLPLGLGLAANRWGLEPTMWLLLAGPLALLIGLPGRQSNPVS